ncbi:MAG: hypothetical protein IT452_07725 [Planctomycetia bacterium]|nr:hypothetical protein [Planctomycetia bacterium]
MIRNALAHTAMSLVFTALGLAAGRWAWRAAPAAPAPVADPHAHAAAVSPQALRNLGVRTGEVRPSSWTRTARFTAVVEVPAGSRLEVRAPAAGTVAGLNVRPGMVVAAGAALAAVGDAAVAAPSGPPDWDVVDVPVGDGSAVRAGDVIAVLSDARAVTLRATSAGPDAAILLDALKAGTPCGATPLLDGTGPVLADLPLVGAAGTADVLAEARNEVLSTRDGGRTWALRPGQKYVLRVPVETLKRAYVLPAGAVASDGPDKVVFLQSGDTFLMQKVVVLHHDAEVAVLDAKASGLAPGDVCVLEGAPALALALRAGGSTIGHGHPH